ncbi:hypothetical protein K2173_018177 [Erythroxylum novogranatense]|uniref:RanBD1 domain-containing protein n=1 Tax=Erythroxylum novogranatense TaxID=1862640 RepID=A0AAV8TN98_9ROSI|nr:hypothetical protein K2173_018177 [Erythroxylum novogranatense]
MKGAKRFAASDSASDMTFQNKRLVSGSSFSDAHRPETAHQHMSSAPAVDMHRAESSRQHVRALNTQFASWVQTQLKDHPDELWEDGVRDYLSHSSNIMEKFSDVVNWLKANAIKERPSAESLASEKKLIHEARSIGNKSFQEKTGSTPAYTNTSITTSFTSSLFSKNPSSGGGMSSSQSSNVSLKSQSSGLFSNTQESGLFSNSQSSGLLSNGQNSGVFTINQSSGVVNNSHSSGLFSGSQSSGLLSKSQNTGLLPNKQNTSLFSTNQSSGVVTNSHSSGLFAGSQSSGLFSTSQTTAFWSDKQNSGVFSTYQSSGAFPSSQSFGLFSNNQTPISVGLGDQRVIPENNKISDDADDENELQQPSSPSVKKSEEMGVIVVHEVKCKLYVRSGDPADKDAWKDKGTGRLSIKCKEGVCKGTKESKPTIVVRNDVGKVSLNALLYPGIKTSLQKNSVVAIFHTSGDDSGNGDSVVPRTFLIRTKTEEDRDKLATAIQEYAPVSRE